MSKVLALDTSNYTTSACVLDSKLGIIWEKRIMLPVNEGMCGVRQNDAVYLHTKNLLKLFNDIPQYQYEYIAASKCPSERDNSYMPCFNVGVSHAKVISDLLGKPLRLYSHQKNHIAAAAFSAGCTDLLNYNFIAYHISGGTTDILLCTPNVKNFDVKRIGGTADISCGQLIDRIGVNLGMRFPCGKLIEQKSSGKLYNNIRIATNNGMYNFSGFQNKADKMKKDGVSDIEICDYILSVVYSFLNNSITYFRGLYGNIPILLSGGVMSNKHISGCLINDFDDIFFAHPYYSVDNALGTAFLCLRERTSNE